MHSLTLTGIAAAAAALLMMAASSPASAVCIRKCTAILPSGFCTKYGPCQEVLESVGTFKEVRSASDCRRYQSLLCDDESCKPVCRPRDKK